MDQYKHRCWHIMEFRQTKFHFVLGSVKESDENLWLVENSSTHFNSTILLKILVPSLRDNESHLWDRIQVSRFPLTSGWDKACGEPASSPQHLLLVTSYQQRVDFQGVGESPPIVCELWLWRGEEPLIWGRIIEFAVLCFFGNVNIMVLNWLIINHFNDD